jgi:hypothetical protein
MTRAQPKAPPVTAITGSLSAPYDDGCFESGRVTFFSADNEISLWAEVLMQSISWLRDPACPDAVRSYKSTTLSLHDKRTQKAIVREIWKIERDFWKPGNGAEAICDFCGWAYRPAVKALQAQGLFKRERYGDLC